MTIKRKILSVQSSDPTLYFTALSQPWPEHALRYVKPVGEQNEQECGVCFEPLRVLQPGGHHRPRVVATNCECTRANQLFHAECMTREFLRNHRVRDGQIEMRCPMARHVVSAGDLRPIFDALFESISSHSSNGSEGSTRSDRSDKSKEVWEGDLSPPGSNSSSGSLDSKTRDVVNMLGPNADRYRDNWKERERREMNNRFGQPHDQDRWTARWKSVYVRRLNADFGEGSVSSQSVLLGYEFSSVDASENLSPQEENYFTPPQGKSVE